jgi:dipeptidyl aminopeptidase/acylaminoacyl peptidase
MVQAFSDLAEHFVCGVICHPSIHLEDYLGRSAVALCEKAKRPILLMPAGNDPESYLEGGAMFTALKANNPESDTVLFKDCVHGWVPRGDFANPGTREAVEEAINRTYAYFAKFL